MRMVATCPFDKGVQLLSKRETKNLMKKGKLNPVHHGYSLFFPEFLRLLRPIEKRLSWLPLGGQYFVIGRHDEQISFS